MPKEEFGHTYGMSQFSQGMAVNKEKYLGGTRKKDYTDVGRMLHRRKDGAWSRSIAGWLSKRSRGATMDSCAFLLFCFSKRSSF